MRNYKGSHNCVMSGALRANCYNGRTKFSKKNKSLKKEFKEKQKFFKENKVFKEKQKFSKKNLSFLAQGLR